MFVENHASGEPLCCKSCRNVIWEQPTHIDFGNGDHADMTGDYHPECAKPILSIKRALDVLTRVIW